LIENLNFEYFPNMNVFRSEQPFFLKILKFLKLKIKKEKKRRGSVTWAGPGTATHKPVPCRRRTFAPAAALDGDALPA
jgi:hypothetical protein